VPLEVYAIVKEWMEGDFRKNFKVFIGKITEQYHHSYGRFSKKGKKIYDGWQHIGGGTAFWGSNYHVGDRHFVLSILKEVFENQYRGDPQKTWKFIKNECVFTEKEVSEDHPDFLNRSVIGIIMKRFSSESPKVSEEAFSILKEFLLQRKGIPHKSELIYQEVSRAGSAITSDKKMRLVKVTLDKYKVPVSPFVEEIIRDLALGGNVKAQNEILSWFSNEKYFERGRLGGSVGAASIATFIGKDIDFSIKLLKKFISSDYFSKDKFDLFETYDVARTIAKITKADPQKGILLLNSIQSNKKWGRNQRALFCFGLFDHHEKDVFEKEVLLKVYNEVVDPFLISYNNDPKEISKIIPEGGFREAIVKFAEVLAKDPNLLMKQAIRIVAVFIADPDPYLPGESPDPEDHKFNEHKKIVDSGEDNPAITSVRGWCGWTLMKCSVSEGRSEIENISNLVFKLLRDENYYVIHMACFALAQLAAVRLTHTDQNKSELFLDPDPRKALKKAKVIEKEAFSLFERVVKIPEENARKVLGKSVLKSFDSIRSLNQRDAIRFLALINKMPFDVREEAAPFFMYYAFFRKSSYKKFKFKFPGLYDDIDSEEYDESVFEGILEKDIKDLQKTKPDSCFKIAANIERILKDNAGDKTLETKSFKILSLIAEKYSHHTSGLLHRISMDMFEKSTLGFDKWFGLLKLTYEAELAFYDNEGLLVDRDKMPPTANQYYWYPSLWNKEVLDKVFKFGEESKFLEIFEIILSFPLGFELHIDGQPLDTLKSLALKGNTQAKKLLKKLYDFDPGKWRDFKSLVK
jgi:hypothetical protein